MIEFDVDMGYLLEEGELDKVVLNDENGEHEPMEFRPSGGECELSEINTDDAASEWMSNRWWVFDSVYRCSCGETFGHVAEKRPRFCPACGARVRAVKR